MQIITPCTSSGKRTNATVIDCTSVVKLANSLALPIFSTWAIEVSKIRFISCERNSNTKRCPNLVKASCDINVVANKPIIATKNTANICQLPKRGLSVPTAAIKKRLIKAIIATFTKALSRLSKMTLIKAKRCCCQMRVIRGMVVGNMSFLFSFYFLGSLK